VFLRAGTQSGVAEVQAFSGSARSETPIMVQIGGAAAAGVTVTANPAVVPALGGVVTISASVSDTAGNRLNGVSVSFSTTAGTLGTSQVTTDESGVASTTLTTNVAATVSGTVTGTVAVSVTPAPTISITQNTAAPTAGGTTLFSVVTSMPAGGASISSVTVDFGDGTQASLGSLTGSSSVSHVYSSAGTYQVVATVVDSIGQTVNASAVVTVTPAVPLNVNLTASPSPGTVNEVVTFAATVGGSTVPIQSFEWSFGDGSFATTSGSSTNHVYTTTGTRTVSVTATTTEGVSGTATISVILLPLQVEIAITVSPQTPTTNQTVTFTATVTPASVIVTQYDWDFGDGDSVANAGRVTTHAYTAANTFLVQVTATLADGSQETTRTSVRVVTP
jgi:PKD repeat protein